MKSFKEYISESKAKEENQFILMDALDAIKEDCQQFLHKVATNGKFHPLYRSISESPWPNWEVKVRKGRPKLSSSSNINDSIKRVFKDKFDNDFKSNALFASGKAGTHAHLIFPIGKFDFIWAQKEKNLYSALSNSDKDGDLYWDLYKADSDNERDKLVKSFLRDNEFVHNTNLAKCADKGYEVMIDCDYYYVIPLDIVKANMDIIKEKLGKFHIKK